MADVKIDLTGVSTEATLLSAAHLFVGGVDKGTLASLQTDTTYKVTADTTAHTITINGIGVIANTSTSTINALVFSASAAAPGGVYTFVPDGTTALFTEANLAAVTSAVSVNNTTLLKITTGLGDDTVTATAAATSVINTGSGNDVLNIVEAAGASAVTTITAPVTLGAGDDSVVVTGGTHGIVATVLGGTGNDTITAEGTATVTATGGTGADAFVQADATAFLNVTDYKYAEGDTVQLAGTAATSFDNAVLSNAGVFKDDTTATVTAQTAAVNNVYQVKVSDTETTPVTKEFWTAKANVSSVAMDASNLTTGYVFDASGAGKATITLGSVGEDAKVTVTATTTTLTAGKASGTVAVSNWTTTNATKDVLKLDADLSIDKTNGNIVSAGTVLTGILTNNMGTDAAQYIKYTENGSTAAASTLAYVGSSDTANIVLDATHAGYDKYINDGATGNAIDASTLTKAMDFRLNNDTEVGKYTGIYSVVGSKAGGTYVGAGNTDTKTTFNLTNATLGSQVWGGGVGAAVDVTFNTDDKESDVVWLGKTDGNVGITNFGTGFKSTNDVIYLYDVADAGNAEYYSAVANGATAYKVQVADDAIATITKAVSKNTGVQLRVKDSAGTINNVAVGTTDAASTIVTTAEANYVIGKTASAADTTVSLTGTKANENFVVRLANDLAGQTTTYTNVGNADLTGVKDDATVQLVGAGTVNGVGSILKAGGKTVDVWGGSAEADTITFSTVAKAANTVWFGTADGMDTVTNFTANATQKNTIRFYDQTLKQIATNYVYAGGTTGTFTNADDATNVLTLQGLTNNASATYGIIDSTGTATNAVVANGTAKLAYTATAKLYMGNGSELDITGAAGASIRLNNDSDVYYSGITTVDASKVTAGTAVLVGSGKDDTTLIGGYGTNALWGGGASADTMKGKTGVVDTFWFDAGDGSDQVTEGLDKADTIKLYNTTSASDVVVTLNSDNNGFVVTKVNDTADSLAVTDTKLAALKGGLTFELGSTQYRYDVTSGQLKAK